MKLVLILAFTLSTPSLFAADPEYAHHPVPKDPLYIKADLYEQMKKALPLPPAANSEAQKQDEKELLHWQKARTDEMCTFAKNEVYVSVQSFYGAPNGPLDQKTVEKLTPFFAQIRNDGDFYIKKLKVGFPRQRPFLYVKGLVPCVPKEVSQAYPSGHATLAKLYALILSDLYPEKREALLKRSEQIGQHRVISGMHHPSDIAAGKILGELIYKEFKKSKKYNEAFSALN